MKMCVLAGAAALAASGFASAGFVGMVVESQVIQGVTQFRVYAQFDNANDTVLSVFGVANISGNFNQSDLLPGWSPLFTTNAETDSYVLIGGGTGLASGNSTNADPNWGGAGFSQPGIPNGAGWFNSNPPNLQGRVDAVTLRTLVAQFTFAGDIAVFTSPVFVGYNQGLGTATQFSSDPNAPATFSFTVPTPGAIALLGLAGLAGRRRRA